jgi:hypothetical protein
MRLSLKTMAALAVVSMLAAGCDEKLSEIAGATPNLQPTFTSIQRDIFDAPDATGRPACTRCHNPQGARFTAGLDLTAGAAYGNLVGVASTEQRGRLRVNPGNADDSYVVHKIEGAADITGARMPNGGPYLSDGQILIIRRWIALGAPNN